MNNGRELTILVATGIFPPDFGGPATYSKLLLDEMPARGFKVKVLSFGSVRHLPKGLSHLAYFIRLLVLAGSSDFIFAQDTVSVGWPAAVAAKLLGKKFVVRVPGDYAWEQSAQRFGVKEGIDDFQNKTYGFKVEFLRKLQKWTVNQAAVVIAPSLYFKKLVQGWAVSPAKVTAIYNGLKLPETNLENNYNDKPKVLVSAGRLVPWKGFEALIKLMPSLPDWQLQIYGSGPEQEKLSALITGLNLNSRVILKGSVNQIDLWQALKNSRIFVLNTSFESFSFQAVEAMSLGIPVIATNIGNLPEIIESGQEGILVEPNNQEQILSAVKKIDSDQSYRNNLVKNALAKSQNFSIDNTLSQLVDLLKTLC